MSTDGEELRRERSSGGQEEGPGRLGARGLGDEERSVLLRLGLAATPVLPPVPAARLQRKRIRQPQPGVAAEGAEQAVVPG